MPTLEEVCLKIIDIEKRLVELEKSAITYSSEAKVKLVTEIVEGVIQALKEEPKPKQKDQPGLI